MSGSERAAKIAASSTEAAPYVYHFSHHFFRTAQAPLPLRILTPILYNTARLGYLWQWITTSFSSPACMANSSLAIANGVYWFVNLFFLLLPVASMRYMRAHFFGVEALEVTTRIGMEESIGLIPIRQPGD